MKILIKDVLSKILGLFIIQNTHLVQDNNFFYLMFNSGRLFGPGLLFFLSKVQFRTLIWPRRLFGTEEYIRQYIGHVKKM